MTSWELNDASSKDLWRQVRQNPYVFALSTFASLGGFLFGYDQGVVSGVLEMQSFAAKFPRIYLDSGFKGWFVSTLLLAAWFGSLLNGPIADRFGRKGSIIGAVVIFVLGSAIQAGATTIPMLFGVDNGLNTPLLRFLGRAVAGLSVGMLTMVVPMYMSEVSTAGIRGTLVVLQQLSITLGILISYWLEYGTQYIGGRRCAPNIPYTGGTTADPKFDPINDVEPHGCTGQSEAAWRIPFAFQVLPALVLGVGICFFPESPRYHLMCHQEQEALQSLTQLRRVPADTGTLRDEFLMIKAEVLFHESLAKEKYPGKAGVSLYCAQYISLVSSWPAFKRLAVGCCTMFFQQFMGCAAMIYYLPTIFTQLGLPSTVALLATGIYGIVNTLSTLPALFLIDRVGRRRLLMAGAVGTFASLMIVGVILAVYGADMPAHATAGYTAIVFIYFYDFNFSYSFAPIGWVLPSEIFNLDNRAKAIAITTSTTWMSNFVIGLITPSMLQTIGWGTYVFFGAFCLLALVFVYFFVPETKGKSLEDMDVVFGDEAAHEEKVRLFNIAASVGLTTALSFEKRENITSEVEDTKQQIV